MKLPRPAWVHLEGFRGNLERYAVVVVADDRSKPKCRVRPADFEKRVRLAGHSKWLYAGATALVPRDATSRRRWRVGERRSA